MVDVTIKNFNTVVECIKDNLENASFVCLDFEFSGLHTNRGPKVSLFDTPPERYHILKESCRDFTPLQCGLTVFTYDVDSRIYKGTTYNFALHPRTFKDISLNVIYETSACDFLMNHDFDFNKSFYGGVPYLNERQISDLAERQRSSSSIDDIILNEVKEAFRARKHATLRKWAAEARVREKTLIDCFSAGMMEVLLSDVMGEGFPELIAYQLPDEKSTMEIVKVTPEQKVEYVEVRREEEQEALSAAIGFTHVVRAVRAARKPIVGHNVLMDLLYLYEKFYEPLPDTYAEFKERFTAQFPEVYDTRHIISNLKVALRKDPTHGDLFRSTSLLNLYEECEGRSVRGQEYQPRIRNNLGSEMGMRAHEAGNDSFLTGSVFIRLAHFTTLLHHNSPTIKPFHYLDYLREFARYKNCVNLIRCSLTHINMAGPDPEFGRPQWLVVSRLDGVETCPEKVSRVFSAFGDVSARSLPGGRCLVALPSINMAAGVLVEMERHPLYRVRRYKEGRGWGGMLAGSVVIAATAVSAAVLVKRFLT